MTDRPVRFTEGFFERLESLLANKRSGDGAPSITDFLLFEVPPIRDKLARSVETETLSTDDPHVRVYVGAGVLVRHIAIYVEIRDDGSVEAFWLSIER